MSYARDRFIADETARDAELQCKAQGCPLAWSAEVEGLRLCGAHHKHRYHPAAWPRITADLQRAEADRSMSLPVARAPASPLSDDRKRAILANLAAKLGQMGTGDPRRWVLRLKRAEEKGRPLTLYQRHAWREILGEPMPPPPAPEPPRQADFPILASTRPYSELGERNDEVGF